MSTVHETIQLPTGRITLTGDLETPSNATSLVIFSHGSGSSRLSPRNKLVARHLRNHGMATFLLDLLIPEEEDLRFNIPLLSERLVAATEWLWTNRFAKDVSTGYFGASTGAASALTAAAYFGERILAVVSRGGRPDMAMQALPNVRAATLLIIGSLDTEVIKMNEEAFAHLHDPKELVVVPEASHLFEEPGKLEEVAAHAGFWFSQHLHHVVASE